MISRRVISRKMPAAGRALSLTIFALAAVGQNAPRMAPIPGDRLEMSNAPIQVVEAPANRVAAVQLLARARNSYGLRNSGQGYDLKVTFTVNSGGATEYDGVWEMEDVSDPKEGLRWTAKAAAGYATTQISSKGMFYGDGASSTIPLRLQEARAALFDPIPAARFVNRQLIRASTSTFNGVPLTCLLLSNSRIDVTAASGRSWEETEECIDPQSGLLQIHSQVPGRYYAYDYSNAPQLGSYVLPRKVTVTEGGKTVSVISVESLSAVESADPSLFVPTEEMLARGPAVEMADAQKLSRLVGGGKAGPSAVVQPVCVFGLVTPSGEVVEVHSLQPSDANSTAAVEAVKQMSFPQRIPPGARPQQHFVFVIAMFVVAR